jgi:hypothetical protein
MKTNMLEKKELKPNWVSPTTLIFVTVKKVKPLQAKPMQCLLNDKRVMTNFLLNTLEGTQMLKANSMVCIGVCGDVWQQDIDKLHKAYTPVEVDEEGWITFVPKPEARRDACQIFCKFNIMAQWGTKQTDGSFVQTGNDGDYILRSKEDIDDVWIVAKKVFESTYQFEN